MISVPQPEARALYAAISGRYEHQLAAFALDLVLQRLDPEDKSRWLRLPDDYAALFVRYGAVRGANPVLAKFAQAFQT